MKKIVNKCVPLRQQGTFLSKFDRVMLDKAIQMHYCTN